MTKLIAISITVTFLLLGCSFDYDEDVLTDALSEEQADLIIKDGEFIIYRESKISMRIESLEASSFTARSQRVFKTLKFFQFDRDGKILAEGVADKATYQIQAEIVVFEGAIKVAISQEDAYIETDYLSWESKTDMLKGIPGGKVAIVRNDGSRISGTDFFVDLRTKVMEISGGVEGVIGGN